MTDCEVYEVVTNAQDAQSETNALLPQEYIDMLYQYEEMKAKMKVLEEEKKKALLEVMEKYNITEIDNEKWNVKLVNPKPSKTVDDDKLKAEGLYDLFTKDKKVSPYVKVSLKYDE